MEQDTPISLENDALGGRSPQKVLSSYLNPPRPSATIPDVPVETAGVDEGFEAALASPAPLPAGGGDGLVEVREIGANRLKRYYWSDEAKRLLRELYFQGQEPSSLALFFGVPRTTVYKQIDMLGLKAARDDLERRVSARISAVLAEREEFASKIDHSKFLEKCSYGALKILERSIEFGEKAVNPRDISAAATALAKAMMIYRTTHGMDRDAGSRGGTTYNFTLVGGNSPLRSPVKQAQPA